MNTKTNANDQNKIQHRKGMDALRGIGITGIVLYHLFPSLFPGGFLGVPLFFVLSGYLMFVTSEHSWRRGTFRVGNYYKKRIRKILPPLFVMVMATCCYLTLTHSSYLIGIRQEICSIFLGYDNWWQIGQHASYFSKLAAASPFTHLWFLAVEIQFYLLWPILFILYKKGCQIFGGKKMCFAFLLLALLSAGRMLYLYVPGGDPSRVYYGTDTMAFPILLGMFLGALRKEYPGLQLPRRGNDALGTGHPLPLFSVFVLILCILFLIVDGQFPFLYQGGMFLISLFYAGMIHLIENQQNTRELLPRIPLLSLLGQKSYGIYLWHYPIMVLALI